MLLDIKTSVPIIVGITEGIKRLGVPSRLMPIISMLLGIGYSYLIAGNLDSWAEGLVVGLSAAGLWDLGKKTILNK